MKKHLYILTGSSRGLGLAIAQELLQQGVWLLGIARHPRADLAEQAQQYGSVLEQWPRNLKDSVALADELQTWLQQRESSQIASATLINNAGVIPAINALSEADPRELAHSMRVNLEAPMLLTACFLHATQTLPITRKVLNISSGLGRRPMASQAAYCAAKAGMDHFTRCLALDEARKSNGAKVCSLAPGVIETDMQSWLRSGAAEAFPDQGYFVQLHTHRQLNSPQNAARQVLAWLHQPAFGQQVIADIRQAQSTT